MFFKGKELMEAWADFEWTEPVRAADVTDDPAFLAYLGDSRIYPVSRKTSDALLPLMHTPYSGQFSYNGAKYAVSGRLCEVEQIHMDGRRYFKFPEPMAEEAAQVLRLKKVIQAICAHEKQIRERAESGK